MLNTLRAMNSAEIIAVDQYMKDQNPGPLRARAKIPPIAPKTWKNKNKSISRNIFDSESKLLVFPHCAIVPCSKILVLFKIQTSGSGLVENDIHERIH